MDMEDELSSIEDEYQHKFQANLKNGAKTLMGPSNIQKLQSQYNQKNGLNTINAIQN